MLDTKTYTEILEVVKTYVEGMCLNDPAKLRDAMHEKLCCGVPPLKWSTNWDSIIPFQEDQRWLESETNPKTSC